jgi:hypothetical protein
MFALPAEKRLQVWREFRSRLDLVDLPTALDQIAEMWNQAPFRPYYLDWNDADNWPDPWQLIIENSYCDIAKCLGIVYTMALTKYRDLIDLEMRHYVSTETGYEYNLAWIQEGKYILNLVDREVVNIERFDHSLNLLASRSAAELGLFNY